MPAIAAVLVLLLIAPSFGQDGEAQFPDVTAQAPTDEAREASRAYFSDHPGFDNIEQYVDIHNPSYQVGVMDAILFSHINMGKYTN